MAIVIREAATGTVLVWGEVDRSVVPYAGDGYFATEAVDRFQLKAGHEAIRGRSGFDPGAWGGTCEVVGS